MCFCKEARGGGRREKKLRTIMLYCRDSVVKGGNYLNISLKLHIVGNETFYLTAQYFNFRWFTDVGNCYVCQLLTP
jgi:hypothetical protein